VSPPPAFAASQDHLALPVESNAVVTMGVTVVVTVDVTAVTVDVSSCPAPLALGAVKIGRIEMGRESRCYGTMNRPGTNLRHIFEQIKNLR
jgi:hypothetical protein